jgi:hypothetical protein
MAKNFAKLTVRDIESDPAYQRELDEPRVEAMAKAIDLTRIGVPVVALRKGGKYVVLDGQHRIAAMRMAGLEAHKIFCEVYNGLNLIDEAALFLKLNNGRKSVRAFDKYRAQMTAQEPATVEMTRIVNSLGLKIGAAPSKNTICAIRSLESVYKRGGNLDLVLAVLKQWGRGDAAAFDGDLIKDMSRFFTEYQDVDVDGFVTKLISHDPTHVGRRIKALSDVLQKNRRLAAISVLREIYNHGRRKKDQLAAVENIN